MIILLSRVWENGVCTHFSHHLKPQILLDEKKAMSFGWQREENGKTEQFQFESKLFNVRLPPFHSP